VVDRSATSINSAMLHVTLDREDRSINPQYTNDQLLLTLQLRTLHPSAGMYRDYNDSA